jgi:DNA modification methylase
LLHKTIRTNRVMSRQGFADYLVTMRKPGDAEEKITGLLDTYVGEKLDEDFTKWCQQEYNEHRLGDAKSMDFETFKSIQIWQRYASPVWDDINPSETLQRESAREEKDERHIAPLQLQVIERAIQLWTAKGDRVLSPFGGIGSEGYVAVKLAREAVICELKKSYFSQACLNLKRAESEQVQAGLFDEVATA